jgi:hypothetical protein
MVLPWARFLLGIASFNWQRFYPATRSAFQDETFRNQQSRDSPTAKISR